MQTCGHRSRYTNNNPPLPPTVKKHRSSGLNHPPISYRQPRSIAAKHSPGLGSSAAYSIHPLHERAGPHLALSASCAVSPPAFAFAPEPLNIITLGGRFSCFWIMASAQREESTEASEWAGISESGDDDMDFEVCRVRFGLGGFGVGLRQGELMMLDGNACERCIGWSANVLSGLFLACELCSCSRGRGR